MNVTIENEQRNVMVNYYIDFLVNHYARFT